MCSVRPTGVNMLIDIMAFRKRFKAVVRDEKNGPILWTSCEWGSEDEVREAIKKLEHTDWNTVVVQSSKY